MQTLHNIKNWLVTETKALFLLQKTDRLWHIALLAFLCMAIPLSIGLYYNHLDYSILVCTGALVILYLPQAHMGQRMLVMVMSSFGFVASFAVGLLFNYGPLSKIISLTLFTFIVHLICLYFNFKSPGSTFFILLASIAAFTSSSYTLILPVLGLVAAGTAIACIIALAYSLATYRTPLPVIGDSREDNHSILLESLVVSLFVGISLILAHLFKLEKPYWVPVSCMAVMRGINVQHVYQRGFQRILGTMAGLGLSRLLLSVETTPLSLVITIPALQFAAEILVARNYALALIFITPMALLLAEAGNGLTVNENTIIITRLYDITLGSMVGALGGYMLYHQRLRETFRENIPL